MEALKVLTAQKEAVEKESEELQKTRTKLQQQLNLVTTRLVELQGKWALLEQLEKEFNSKEE